MIKLLINLEDCGHKSEVFNHRVEDLKDHDSESESDKGVNSPSYKPDKFLNVVNSLHIGIERNEELCVSESEDEEQDSYE